MAYDKVTKIDAIAKRKAWTKTHLGVLEEYRRTTPLEYQPLAHHRPLNNRQRRAKSACLIGYGDASNRMNTSWPSAVRVQYGAGDARK
jgi:hypothetical protein